MESTLPQTLRQTISLLTYTPTTLSALLRELPETLTHSNEGHNTWTVFDVIVHLNHCERTNWMPRAKMILESGESQPFPPLDRESRDGESQTNSLPQLLDEFSLLRSANLHQIRALNLQRADLDRRGLHPAFGLVTLSQLLSTWATHDLTHLHQISRILAHQFREAVGPWSVYLGVLQCTGHSAP